MHAYAPELTVLGRRSLARLQSHVMHNLPHCAPLQGCKVVSAAVLVLHSYVP